MSHRALAVDDILREVAGWVVDTHPPTAISLACCAKTFEEPALSALWKIQDELWILIRALPPDSWDLRPAIFGTALATIVRDLPSIMPVLHFDKELGSRVIMACLVCRFSLEPRRKLSGAGSKDTRRG